ncbi:MAG: hypothetical protein ACFWUC_03340 [Oscillospiraceae bacterium]|jgi:uncharacterized protein
MLPEEMEALIRTRQYTRKTKQKNQVPYAAAVLFLACAAAVLLWLFRKSYLVFWVVGIAIGIVLRYSRFCFAAAFRDPVLIHNTKLMRALLLALMISSAGFAAVQYRYLQNHPNVNYSDIPGILNSVGLHTAVGAFLFGIGMVIAGGCASGVLMRIGEGHSLPWFALLGFFAGTVLGANHYSFWVDNIIHNAAVIYFPEHFNFGVVLLLQTAVLIALYFLASWYQRRNAKG